MIVNKINIMDLKYFEENIDKICVQAVDSETVRKIDNFLISKKYLSKSERHDYLYRGYETRLDNYILCNESTHYFNLNNVLESKHSHTPLSLKDFKNIFPEFDNPNYVNIDAISTLI